jgi:hypothetical protein
LVSPHLQKLLSKHDDFLAEEVVAVLKVVIAREKNRFSRFSHLDRRKPLTSLARTLSDEEGGRTTHVK